MAFPISPTVGGLYDNGDITYEWNEESWDIYSSEVNTSIEHFDQDTEPTARTLGDTWYLPANGAIYKWVDDYGTHKWVSLKGANRPVTVVQSLPTATLLWFELGIYVIDNTTEYVCVADTLTPLDADCFWLQR